MPKTKTAPTPDLESPPAADLETPPAAGEDGIDLDTLDELAPADEILDDEDDDGDPPAPAGEDEDDDPGKTEDGDDGDPPPAGDETDEEDEPSDGEPAPEPKPEETPADDADLAWLDEPDVYDESGRQDPLKYANFVTRVQNARSAEIDGIIADVRTAVPEATAEDIDALRRELLASTGDVRGLREARKKRLVTGSVRLAVDDAIRAGKVKPAAKPKAPPVPRSTPNNAADEAPRSLTSKEESELKAMLNANPGMDPAAVRKSYIAGKKKPS